MSLTREELFLNTEKYIDIKDECDVLKADCDSIEFLLDNCEITIPEKNRFFVTVNCDGIQNYIYSRRINLFKHEIDESRLSIGNETLAYTGDYDFSHTTTEWESVIKLGIKGLRKRISQYGR